MVIFIQTSLQPYPYPLTTSHKSFATFYIKPTFPMMISPNSGSRRSSDSDSITDITRLPESNLNTLRRPSQNHVSSGNLRSNPIGKKFFIGGHDFEHPSSNDFVPFLKTTRLSVEGPVECELEGFALLNSALFNKGSAFTLDEREEFNLTCLLPPAVDTLDEQLNRAYKQFKALPTDLMKNEFCTSLRLQNKVLFYELVKRHIKEVFHIIYTPTVGDAIINYSNLFRKPEGCMLDITRNNQMQIEKSLEPFGTDEDIDYIVVSDGEGVLGIGDQGVGGIGIVIGKLALMTACAGIHPGRVIPVTLDVGTNNQKLLDDPLYLGNRFPRVRGEKYDRFVYNFIQVIKKRFPSAVLHFEDFGVTTARKVLNSYRGELPCFNDDIQGTGAVVMSSITAGLKITSLPLNDIKVVIFGAGSAGLGIAFQIVDNLVSNGLSLREARDKINLVDRQGLLLKSQKGLMSQEQALFACEDSEWEGIDTTKLVEIIKKVQPQVLVGCSTRPKAFTEEVVKEMHKYVSRPMIFPLSNPTRLHEAVPSDLLAWTNGQALVATGSPFAPVNGKIISENNNCFTFPGIGLGAVLSRAKIISNGMIAAAVTELASMSPSLEDENGGLLPQVTNIREVSARVATAVVLETVKEQSARVIHETRPQSSRRVEIPDNFDDCLKWVKTQMWDSNYRPMVKPPLGRSPSTHQF